MTPLALAKAIGGPGSIGFLITGSLVGLVLIRVRWRMRIAGRIWLAVLFASYLVMALPPVAQAMAAPFADDLAGQRILTDAIDTLVIFDGDNHWARVTAGARLWRATHAAIVIASGEPWLEEHLRDAGIPASRLVHDQDSRTTREQVEYVKTYAARHPGDRVAIVASRLQIPRIAGLLQRAGVAATLYGAPVDHELATGGIWRYLPTYAALCVTRDAFYERVALVYYRWNGWIGGPNSPSFG